VVLLALLVACVAATPASAATFVVTTTADGPPPTPDGVCPAPCSLREAIQEANDANGLDRIEVPAGVYGLGNTGAGDNANATGDLDITEGVNIVGAGARTTIVDGLAQDRVIHVTAAAAFVTISGVTIRNGAHNFVDTSVGGGGVANFGVETHLIDVAVVGNVNPDNPGGGIFENGSNVVTAEQRNLRLTRVLVSGNSGRAGAGLYSLGRVTIENATFSGNNASNPIGSQGGGAIENDGSAASLLTNAVTFAGNTAPAGFGTSINVFTATQPRVANTIFADTAGSACNSALNSDGQNIERGATCGLAGPNDHSSLDPQIGPLADNGGPTDSHLPARTSPAVDTSTAFCLPLDQRGVTRPFGAACDVGAVELVYAVPAPPRPSSLVLGPLSADRRPGDANVVTATVRNDNGTAAQNATIRWSIAGPNEGDGTATTDANGQARIEWDGVRTGTDTLTAYVDVNGDSAPLAEPSGSVTVIWSLPAPRQGRTVNLEPVSGIVRIRLPGNAKGKGAHAAGGTSSLLREATQVPINTVVDVRKGRVEMSALAGSSGNIQKGQFYGGVYQTVQPRKASRPYTELRLTEQLVCRSSGSGKLAPARARSRGLWGNARGRFRTRGRHSTATVRGTVWLQKDTCTKTTTLVREGTVIVKDFARRKNVRVKAGRRYVARQRSTRRR
jgi:CSLREA domain-containing protein